MCITMNILLDIPGNDVKVAMLENLHYKLPNHILLRNDDVSIKILKHN